MVDETTGQVEECALLYPLGRGRQLFTQLHDEFNVVQRWRGVWESLSVQGTARQQVESLVMQRKSCGDETQNKVTVTLPDFGAPGTEKALDMMSSVFEEAFNKAAVGKGY